MVGIVLLGLMSGIALMLIAWCVAIMMRHAEDDQKWSAIEANVPSSVLTSLVIGLAVGIGGYYIQRSQQHYDDQSSKKAEDASNQLAVEVQIETNLIKTQKALTQKIQNAKGISLQDSALKIREDISAHPLVTGFWQSLSSSGRTHYIESDDLLERISDTYDLIQTSAKCEEVLFSLVNSSGFAVNARMSDGQEIPLWYSTAGVCARSYGQALEAVEGTLSKMKDSD